ncbi:MAG: DUF4131 domain-containing protein, partial [Planctomycetota bacterium]
GKVISSVRTDAFSRGLSAIPWLSSQSSFYIQTEQIRSPDGWQKATGKVRVQVSEPLLHVKPGNTVRIDCWLSHFSPPANPGQFDLRKHMHRRGVYLAASVPIAEGIEVVDPSESLLPKTRSALYHLASDALLDETATDNTVRSLTSALLLGQRQDLNPKSGSLHQSVRNACGDSGWLALVADSYNRTDKTPTSHSLHRPDPAVCDDRPRPGTNNAGGLHKLFLFRLCSFQKTSQCIEYTFAFRAGTPFCSSVRSVFRRLAIIISVGAWYPAVSTPLPLISQNLLRA